MDSEQQQTQQQDEVRYTEKPEVKEEHREKAKEMAKEYEDDRPTVTLPGSDGTVSGTAIADWTDEDGNKLASEESKSDDDG